MLSQLPKLHQALLRYLGAPTNLQGSYIAADQLHSCLDAAHELHPSHLPADWVVHSQRLAGDMAKMPNHAHVSNRAATGQRAYDLFIATHKIGVYRSLCQQINAAFGLIVAHCTSQEKFIHHNIIDAYVQLLLVGKHRSDKNPEWVNLARSFPMDMAAVKAWQMRSGIVVIQDFLHAYALALAKPIASLSEMDDSAPEGGEGHRPENPSDLRETQVLPFDVAGTDTDGANENLIGWLLQRANHGGYISFFGESNRWNRLSIDELRAVCHRITPHLNVTDPHCKYALLAVLSLCSSLPIKKAVKLRLHPNNKIWLDPTRKAIRWNLRAVLDANAPLSETAPEPTQTIDIWLPALAADVLSTFHQQHPHARTLAELMSDPGHGPTNDATITHLIDGYRAWLSSIGYESRHGALDARFAASIGQIYLRQHGDVVAALLGLDFAECSTGMLHYCRFDPAFLYLQTQLAYADLGLDNATPFTGATAPLGSPHALPSDDFFQGIRTLLTSARKLRFQLRNAMSVQEMCSLYNQLVHHRLLTIISLTGGRDQRLNRMTWDALYGHAEYVFLSDKDMDEYSLSRIVPVTTLLRRVLDSHAQDLDLLQYCAVPWGLVPSAHEQHRLFSRERGKICFFTIALTAAPGKSAAPDNSAVRTRHRLVRKEVSWSAVEALSQQVFTRKANVGRHTWVSMLLAQGIDRWLIKTLTGHTRVHAEPFSDGQAYIPEHALLRLRKAMEWALRPLTELVLTPLPKDAKFDDGYFEGGLRSAVLSLSQPRARLPTQSATKGSANGDFARVLPTPFDPYTLLSVRVVEHLRIQLLNGMGPTQPNAHLMLCLMLIDGIVLQDVEQLWHVDHPFQRLTKSQVAAVYSRQYCRAQIRRPLCGPTLLILTLYRPELQGSWMMSCRHVQRWLQTQLSHLMWPSDTAQAMQCLAAMISRWQRFTMPPFLLTATSPALTTPTASAGSMMRLLERAPAPDLSTLRFPPPTGRLAKKRVAAAHTALARAIAALNLVQSNQEASGGEDEKRIAELKRAITALDYTQHGPANMFKDWILAECALWEYRGQRKPIVVNSMATYCSNLKPVLITYGGDIDFRAWHQEWHNFICDVEDAATGETVSQRKENRATRLIAAKRMVETLRGINYSIPNDLQIGNEEGPQGDGMRLSAASTLILQSDKERVFKLVSVYFSELPFEQQLAELYTELRFALPLRSAEAEALALSAVSELDQLVITPEGFDNLKSNNSPRVLELSQALAAQFRRVAALVLEAYPAAKWIFYLDDATDRSTIHQIKLALAAAIKQVTGDNHARAHATRSGPALDMLTPDWESLLRDFLHGKLSSPDCHAYCTMLTTRNNSVVAEILRKTGHGHPRTYLNYYFALGDVLTSVFTAASLNSFKTVRVLTTATSKTIAAAYRKALSRHTDSVEAFDEWSWLRNYAAAQCAHLPDYCELEQAAALEAPRRNMVLRAKPQSDDASSPLGLVRYLALRIVGMGPQAAAAPLELSGTAMRSLESLLGTADFSHLRGRHQFSTNSAIDAGAKSEIEYLLSNEGQAFANKLMESDTKVLVELLEALSKRRARKTDDVSVAILGERLRSFSRCLPKDLGLLVQAGRGKLNMDDFTALASSRDRIYVGHPDADLGFRPRISVVPRNQQDNLVLRARRTANARCLLQAVLLLRAQDSNFVHREE